MSKQAGLPKAASLNLSLPIPATIPHTLGGKGVVPGGRGPGSTPCAVSLAVRARQRTVTTTSPPKSLLEGELAAFILVPFCLDKAGGPWDIESQVCFLGNSTETFSEVTLDECGC